MDITLDSVRGEEFVFVGAVTKNKVPYPTTVQLGTTLVFTAKRQVSDSNDDAVVRRDCSLADGGAYTVPIHSTDTEDFTKTTMLQFSVVLTEPSGEITSVVKGYWRVEVAAAP